MHMLKRMKKAIVVVLASGMFVSAVTAPVAVATEECYAKGMDGMVETVTETSSEDNNSSESNTGNDNGKSETGKEETDPETGLLTPESAYRRFMEKVAFMEEDANFEKHLSQYHTDVEKEMFLEANANNTEEQWNTISNFDFYIYYVTYLSPNLRLQMYDISSLNGFIDKMKTQKISLDIIPRGNEVYDALVELWEWQYNYYLKTGRIYDFHNGGIGETVPAESKEEIKDSEQKEMEELAKELEKEIQKEEKKETEDSKSNKTIPLVCVGFLIVAIAFLGVCLFLRKKK